VDVPPSSVQSIKVRLERIEQLAHDLILDISRAGSVESHWPLEVSEAIRIEIVAIIRALQKRTRRVLKP